MENCLLSEYIAKVKKEIVQNEVSISSITSIDDLNKNFKQNNIPTSLANSTFENYNDFLVERRKLMAKRIKEYYNNFKNELESTRIFKLAQIYISFY